METYSAQELRAEDAFKVLTTTERCQIATMCLQAGETSGEYGNEHPQSDQMLYVIEGEGEAKVEGKIFALSPGMALLIYARERHEIKCHGPSSLKTLNVYAPVAYPDEP